MTRLPEDLPPKWRENMEQRRACLLRYESERPLSERKARAIALELVASIGDGEWECSVVQLDESRRDWEFRFKPHIDRVPRTRLRSVPS